MLRKKIDLQIVHYIFHIMNRKGLYKKEPYFMSGLPVEILFQIEKMYNYKIRYPKQFKHRHEMFKKGYRII